MSPLVFALGSNGSVIYGDNRALGITGALMYENNTFGQVIEGPEKVINALWHKIQKDDRHKNVHLILSKPISERSFSKWTMVFQGNEEMAKALPEVSATIEDIEFPLGHPLLIALRDSVQASVSIADSEFR
jgi:hypothetical protein